jgi:hypothetical protein
MNKSGQRRCFSIQGQSGSPFHGLTSIHYPAKHIINRPHARYFERPLLFLVINDHEFQGAGHIEI